MEDCIFCKIIEGKIPNYTVWEDDNHLAFLTIQPVKPGHTLVIPKKHQPYLFELPDNEMGPLFVAVKKVSKILEKTFKPKTGKLGVLVAGQQVPHIHIHLIPMDDEQDLRKPAKLVPHEELKAAHQQILDLKS